MDSSHSFVVRYKIHSNKEEWLCRLVVTFVSFFCFIYVHNAISDAHYSYNLQLRHIINEYSYGSNLGN